GRFIVGDRAAPYCPRIREVGTASELRRAASRSGTAISRRTHEMDALKFTGRLMRAIVLAGALILFVPPRVGQAAGCGMATFGAPTNFSVGGSPLSVAVGDFNGDGKLDLALPQSNSDNVSIQLGTGGGSFAAPRSFGVGTSPVSVAVGDFDGNGKLDLAV